MSWTIEMHPVFVGEFLEFSEIVQDALLAEVEFLEKYGPQLKRPHADTLIGSRYANMKELRFKAEDGVWRVAFAFDPERKAILLIAGDKSGMSEKLFYRQMIKKADQRFNDHLNKFEEKEP